MTNEEFRASIYQWIRDCYQINVTTSEHKENRKKLKAIVEGFNPTQKVVQVFQKKDPVTKTSDWKPYPNTK